MSLNDLWHISKTVCLLIAVSFICMGCEHRPLYILEDITQNENIFVRVYFDEHLRNVNFGFYDDTKEKPEYSSPQMIRVAFYDKDNSKLVSERYLSDCGRDEQGYYIQGKMNVPNGKYNMLAYNFDTKESNVIKTEQYHTAKAVTERLSESDANRFFASRGEDVKNIYRQPDHLFVTRVEDVEVNTQEYFERPDTIKTNKDTYPTAESIVKTYYLQFNVKGVEYVRSAVALISGMAGSKTIYNGEMVKDNDISIFFGLNNGMNKQRTSDDIAVAYATFNTFGKLPDTEGYLDVTFEFKTIYNTVQTETFRITDIFETEMAKENQWIIIDKVVEIIPPEGADTGGGLAPGVSEWEQIEGSITI
ncbi:MAG: DUF5119 domain-containing protein [Bacteroidaceae bacterium]|nr:DUF5119 domain-containing protein [Bacteroidaceae bacterium]